MANGKQAEVMQEVNDVEVFSSEKQMAMRSSLPANTFKDRKMLMSLTSQAHPLSKYMGAEIDVVGYIVIPATQINDETGEVEMTERLFLFDAEKNVYFTTSTGVKSSFQQMLYILGEPDGWEEPVTVVMVEKKTNTNRTVNVLEVIEKGETE